jgi:hypothetical protein
VHTRRHLPRKRIAGSATSLLARNGQCHSIDIYYVLVVDCPKDKYQEVKYTDVDYLVFTDAARFMSQVSKDTLNHTGLEHVNPMHGLLNDVPYTFQSFDCT